MKLNCEIFWKHFIGQRCEHPETNAVVTHINDTLILMECELDFAFVDGRNSKVVECDDRGHWSDLHMECVCKYSRVGLI